MNQEEMVKSWLRLVKDPRTNSDILEQAAYWESVNTPKEFEIRFWVASNPNCQSDLLATLSLVKNLKVLIQVAGHRRLREETAGKLLKTHLRQLRKSLALNPTIPVFVMRKLAKDYEDVRECLARNPGIPKEIVKQLAHEKSPRIRAALARNSRISLAAHKFLVKDPQVFVRKSLLVNKALPYEILYDLAKDSDEEVRQVCFERAMDEYPADLSLFQILAEFKNSPTAEKAAEYLANYKEKKLEEEQDPYSSEA